MNSSGDWTKCVLPSRQGVFSLSTTWPEALVCTHSLDNAGRVDMNVLRLMGQRGLLGPDAPVRHKTKRRRIKTVMQKLIYRAGRLIQTGRRPVLGLGAHDRAAQAFMRSFAQFAATA